MSFSFNLPILWPSLHFADSLWPIAPWQWLGAPQVLLQPLHNAEEQIRPYPLNHENVVGAVAPSSLLMEGIQPAVKLGGRLVPMMGTNKAENGLKGMDATSLLPQWHTSEAFMPPNLWFIDPKAAAISLIGGSNHLDMTPSYRHLPSAFLDGPKGPPHHLKTTHLLDTGLSNSPYEASLHVAHLHGIEGGPLHAGIGKWTSSITPPTLDSESMAWNEDSLASLTVLRPSQSHTSLLSNQRKQAHTQQHTTLWNQPMASQDAIYTHDDGPMQVHFHQPIIGHMQMQGTTAPDVRLFKEQVEEALVAIFNNIKTIYL